MRARLAVELIELSDLAGFAVGTIAALPKVFQQRTRRRELVTQLDVLGVGALPITHLTGFISGLLMGVQTREGLREFGITTMFPELVTLVLVREVGPTFVALISGARAASGIASELSTMAVTQQVDAFRALRRNPIEALAAPRTLACIFGFPALSIVGVLAGLYGGYVIAESLQQSASFFFHQSLRSIGPREVIPNLLVKPALFGLVIGIVSSHLGLKAEGGTRAVGSATVRSVVIITVGVLITDYIVGTLFLRFWPPPPG
jgi:phospholipid/cholesterol/gamma-HCH transport system permease protein